jgi:hypothetical protein
LSRRAHRNRGRQREGHRKVANREAKAKNCNFEILREVQMNSNKETNVKEYFKFGEVLGYFFRKKDPDRKSNFNLRMMHGINKISIIMFLAGMIYLLSKYLF